VEQHQQKLFLFDAFIELLWQRLSLVWRAKREVSVRAPPAGLMSVLFFYLPNKCFALVTKSLLIMFPIGSQQSSASLSI